MMIPIVGRKYLITTNNWFYAPDGEQYRAIFGTVHGILNDKEILGIKTNRQSTDWYISIGNIYVAGCQVHYCVQTDEVSFRRPSRRIDYKGKVIAERDIISGIYDADSTYGA